jgi:hypothetical protein
MPQTRPTIATPLVKKQKKAPLYLESAPSVCLSAKNLTKRNWIGLKLSGGAKMRLPPVKKYVEELIFLTFF